MNRDDSTYCRIIVKDLNRRDEDTFTSFCFEFGAQGAYEDLSFTQPELTYDPTVIDTPLLTMNVIFPTRPEEEFFLRATSEFAGIRLEPLVEAERDWLEEWRKGFKPFAFVEPFWVVPPWCEPPVEAGEVLWIEPGMAFGTGTHETTRLAATLLLQHWPQGQPALKVLDVGTGTAILALIGERKGAAKCVGLDIDPEARRVARENLEINSSSRVEIPEHQLQTETETYDIVIANIIDGVLVHLRDDLLRVLKPGGLLLLSGILAEREERFMPAFFEGRGGVLANEPEVRPLAARDRSRLKVLERLALNEWIALIVRG